MPVYWSLSWLLLPQIYTAPGDCLIWPTLGGVNPNSLWRHECTLWRDHGYNANANLRALTSVAIYSISFDWRNQYDKRLNWSKSNFSKCGIKATRHGCAVLPKIYKHTTRSGGKIPPSPNCSKTARDSLLWRHQRTNNNSEQRCRWTGFAYFNCTVCCELI